MISLSFPIAQLLLFRFSLDRSADFRFFHSPTLVGFLHARLGTSPDEGLPRGVRQLAVESGRVHYNGGRYYHFGVALLPGSELSMRALIERLSMRNAEPLLRDAPLGPRARLVSVTDLVSGDDVTVKGDAEPLSYGDICKAAAPISESTFVTIRFDSPLLILRQPVQRRDTFLDDQEFDPDVFLNRVERAVQVGWPAIEKGAPRLRARLRANNLVRAETYYRGACADKGGKILPGAAGQIDLGFSAPIGQDWAARLLLAGLYGVGKSTGMGQGRFRLVGAPLHPNWPPPAAEALCGRIAGEGVLTKAREALERESSLSGVANVERIEFLERLPQRLPSLKEQVTSGEYRPRALCACEAKPKSLALPTAQDRF